MEFVIFLTYKCNFNCAMCYQSERVKSSNESCLKVEEWEILFDSLVKKIPHPVLLFMGGEPLVYKDFDKIIKMAHSKGIWSHVITNGFLLEKHLDTLLETDSGVTLSLHGFEKTHNKIVHNEQSFSKVINILERLKEYNSNRKRKYYFRVNTVLLPDNIDEMKDFVKFIEKFNVTNFYINHPNFANVSTETKTVNIFGNSGCSGEFQMGLLKEMISKVQDVVFVEKVNNFFNWLNNTYKHKNVIEYPNFTEAERFLYYDSKNFSQIRKNRLCVMPWKMPYILPNGDIKNCMYSKIGNFLERDFWEIWQKNISERNLKLREYLKKNGGLPICRRCCCFYDNNYLYAKDNVIKLKNGVNILLDEELTMVEASSDGYFVWNIDKPQEGENIPAIAMPYKNDKERIHIENCEKILGKFSDIL